MITLKVALPTLLSILKLLKVVVKRPDIKVFHNLVILISSNRNNSLDETTSPKIEESLVLELRPKEESFDSVTKNQLLFLKARRYIFLETGLPSSAAMSLSLMLMLYMDLLTILLNYCSTQNKYSHPPLYYNFSSSSATIHINT